MTLTSQAQGDCNILIYLEDNPQVFDLVRVRVSSVVQPISPVHLHLGGQVEFRVMDSDGAQIQ